MTQGNRRWQLNCGDIGNFDISDSQMQMIKKADSVGARFVDIGEALINIAFIRGAVCYYERPSLPAPKVKELTDVERERNIKLLADIKEKLFNKKTD